MNLTRNALLYTHGFLLFKRLWIMLQMNYVDINQERYCEQLYCELSNAIELGDFQQFSNLLLTYREWFPFNYANNELLHMACRQNQIHFVAFLLEDDNVKKTFWENPSILNEAISEHIHCFLQEQRRNIACALFCLLTIRLHSQAEHRTLQVQPHPPLLALTYETRKRKRDEEHSIRKICHDRFRPKKQMRVDEA